MSEVIDPNEVVTESQDQSQQQQQLDPAMQTLQSAIWDDTTAAPAVEQQQQQEPAKTEPKKEDPKQEETVFDEADYIKKTFEVDSVDALKAEREELKKLRETKPELKFENELSDKLFKAIQAGKTKEVTQILMQQERLETLTTAEVTKDNAAEIIKMGMQLKNPSLTQKEVDFQFEQEYSLPREPKQPTQRGTETDEEFEERTSEWKEAHDDWKRRVDNLDMRINIAAKMAKPELETAKSKIVFPELEQTQKQPEPTQEDLDRFKKQQAEFIQSSETTLKSFTGFTAQVKDKDVDYSVVYAPSEEEKQVVGKVMNQFAQDGFNANAIFAERWVNEDGTLNVNQLTKDVLRIYTSDKADAKIANDAAGKRLELYLKDKKNINVNGSGSGTFNPSTQTESEKLAEQFWS